MKLASSPASLRAFRNEMRFVFVLGELCSKSGINMCNVTQVMAALNSQSKSRLVGPNCPGIINPLGCKMGIQPGHVHKPGSIGAYYWTES